MYPIPAECDCLHIEAAALTIQTYERYHKEAFVVDGDLQDCGLYVPDNKELADFTRNGLVSPSPLVILSGIYLRYGTQPSAEHCEV